MEKTPKIKELKDYDFPIVNMVDLAFPTFNAPYELVELADTKNIGKGKAKFNQLFYNGGSLDIQDDVTEDSWKYKALLFAKALMGSFAPKHEHKELVCALIFEETLKL